MKSFENQHFLVYLKRHHGPLSLKGPKGWRVSLLLVPVSQRFPPFHSPFLFRRRPRPNRAASSHGNVAAKRFLLREELLLSPRRDLPPPPPPPPPRRSQSMGGGLAVAGDDEGAAAEEGRWARMLPELLREIIRRVEASEERWPLRKSVVACACVCRRWREGCHGAVAPPRITGKITFPSPSSRWS
uniref:Uncharacterized protein n=1 Tax=Ananas comosus var. bracteatus TaxID=296719 RepID=A0A6V7QJ96_ANACO|nr:unnamed protein product [Ananas comosus var. bracteatus]